jgi:hypothetical protein
LLGYDFGEYVHISTYFFGSKDNQKLAQLAEK